MPNYRTLYLILFNAITDAVAMMPSGQAKELLIHAQQKCEDLYIGDEDE